MSELMVLNSAQLMVERRQFKMPQQTFRILTLNGVTTVAVKENETMASALSRCNRLRDVNLKNVSLIVPATGNYVDLESPSTDYADLILILQTDDRSYIRSTNQHSFNSRLQLNKTMCSGCSGKHWLRRFSFCRECSIKVCSRCVKQGNMPQCSSTSHHHQHFASAVSRFKG